MTDAINNIRNFVAVCCTPGHALEADSLVTAMTAKKFNGPLACVIPGDLQGALEDYDRIKAENERLRAAIAEISTKKQSSYKGRNGRDRYIEDDSGEMMWLVPADAMDIADAALKGGE